jgi:formylmethanofuran:tetrahydromethanopterin formyltransferase
VSASKRSPSDASAANTFTPAVTRSKAVLKISSPKRKAAWQAFSSLYYETLCKATVEAHWHEYQANPPDGKPKTSLEFRTEVIKEIFEQQPDKIKQKVEVYRTKQFTSIVDETEDVAEQNEILAK